ncbi:uncharacterized protein ACA1_324820 [Acanthamoeba castellanii str. Neff]|uniref:Uncharacterized protein n=1 Tax=Acanthamoeba castellanii (strain ATCC 30010 / Neff) TaxID=1257118 RepID=L8GH63_ACACF|nr:uncharacterized protein ACA1_324820 [Acanthamoeba castellanii str. Neff]ELR12435.1 hypothetical protein ACA1_324820 [Acanthamoeba castellanii str. Neff]
METPPPHAASQPSRGLPEGLLKLNDRRVALLKRLNDMLELRDIVIARLDGVRFDVQDLDNVQDAVNRVRDDLVVVCTEYDKRESIYTQDYLTMCEGLADRKHILAEFDQRTQAISNDLKLARFIVTKQRTIEALSEQLREQIESDFKYKEFAPGIPTPPAAAAQYHYQQHQQPLEPANSMPAAFMPVGTSAPTPIHEVQEYDPAIDMAQP